MYEAQLRLREERVYEEHLRAARMPEAHVWRVVHAPGVPARVVMRDNQAHGAVPPGYELDDDAAAAVDDAWTNGENRAGRRRGGNKERARERQHANRRWQPGS